MKREVEVQRVRVLEKVTYAEAVRVVKQRAEGLGGGRGSGEVGGAGLVGRAGGVGQAGGGRVQAGMEGQENRSGGLGCQCREKGWVASEQVVAFVAAAITSTMEVSSKTDRI